MGRCKGLSREKRDSACKKKRVVRPLRKLAGSRGPRDESFKGGTAGPGPPWCPVLQEEPTWRQHRDKEGRATGGRGTLRRGQDQIFMGEEEACSAS